MPTCGRKSTPPLPLMPVLTPAVVYVVPVVAEFGEGFRGHVEDDVAEGAVEAEDFAVEAGGIECGVVYVEADELGDVEGGAGLSPVIAAGEVGSGGREDVAAVEGGGEFGADHPCGICDLAGFEDLVFAGGGEESEEAVVG